MTQTPAASTRHALIALAIRQHARGLITDLDLVGRLAAIVIDNPCNCLACTD